MYIVLKDALIGGTLIGIISYLNEIYKNNINYPKITGFLIAAPIGYFLAVNIFLRNSAESARNYSIHMILGLIYTFLIVLFSIYLLKNKLSNIIPIFVFSMILIILFIYFKFEIYKII